MKKFILIALPLLFISTQVVAQSNGVYVEKKSCTSAVEYNDYIVDLVLLVGKSWSKAIDGSDLATTMKASSELKSITGKVMKSLGKLEGFNGDINFKSSAIDYVTYMNKISKKELPAFLKLIHGKGEFTADKEKKAEALIPALDDRREALFASIESAQADFATKNDFTIEN